jgi:hypothetical protein
VSGHHDEREPSGPHSLTSSRALGGATDGSTVPPPATPSTSGPDPGVAGPEEPWDDARTLEELARIEAELRPRGKAAPASAAPSGLPPAPPDSVAPEWSEEAETFASPYLEERIVRASGSLAAVRRELHLLESRWSTLRESSEELERELGYAAEEIRFLRSRELAVSPGPATGSTDDGPRRTRPSGPDPRAAPAVVFHDFTAERYNRSVSALASRRRALAAWTVGIAAAISGVLVSVALLARESSPPIWLAALPIVWMVPVPFFIVSFVATQRVLRHHQLVLAEPP